MLSAFSSPFPPSWPLAANGLAVAVVAVLLTALLGATGVRAQADSTELRRFRTADARLQAGDAEAAIRILEGLYEESPENASFYRKLKDAYESVKRYDDALRLVEERIDGSPTPSLLSEKARLLYQKGADEQAAATWSDAVSAAPSRPTTYRIVYQTLVEVRRFKQAIDVLTRARQRLDNKALFRTELAYLYGLDGQHAEAMREYVALLDQSPNRVGLVRNRLQTFVEQGEGIQASIEVLRGAVEEAPLNAAYRELLAWLHMTTNNYEAAYDVYRALDRLQQRQGQALFSFAQKAADADRYDVATTALETILDRHGDAPVAPRAQRALGNTYRKWGASLHGPTPTRLDSTARYDAARRAYRTFLETYPAHETAPGVRTQLGTLQLDVYRNLDAAQSTLETVVSSAPQSSAANQARYDLGRVALLRGRFEEARLLFSRLAERLRGGDLADRARFELALLQFYQGQFDGARSRAQATSANTSSDVTNDAIDLSVLIQENRGPDSLDAALHLYASARLAMRQRRYDDASTQLDSLLRTHTRHSLADEARFRRAEVLLARGDTSAALDAYRTLPKRHPRSPYADRSLFQLGNLYRQRGRPERAAAVYNQLLTDYPKSLLAADARTRLRSLRRPRG